MEQISPDKWALMHFGLIFSITCAQMLVVYVLADSSNPPAGLGLYTVYFMASLLGWIALTLRQSAGMLMAIDIPSVITILNSYILFMAAGQRAGLNRGRLILGIACLGACLSVFFLSARQMFVVHAAFAALFFAGAGLLCAWRSWRYSNIGDGIIASGGGLMAIGMPTAIYYFVGAADQPHAQAIVFGVHSAAYALVAIGFLASVLIEYQQHLSHLATEDPLTRLLNRRGLADALQISMAHASRHGLPTSAILVDIDHFKQVNDSFGHEVGDHVIRQVAEMISRMCRASDVVARTGGEEFLLVLPDTTLDAARTLAERIRENVAESALSVDSLQINVTISLGVACISGALDLDELSRDADRAMYLAKHGGRNRVASVEHRSVQFSVNTGQGIGD